MRPRDNETVIEITCATCSRRQHARVTYSEEESRRQARPVYVADEVVCPGCGENPVHSKED